MIFCLNFHLFVCFIPEKIKLTFLHHKYWDFMVLLYGKVLINHHSSNIQKPRVIKRVNHCHVQKWRIFIIATLCTLSLQSKKFVSSISFFEIYILWSNSDIKCLIIIAPQWPPEVIWDTLWMFKNNSRDNLVIHWTFSQHKTGLRNQKFLRSCQALISSKLLDE